jgi:hypothetical protein
VASVTTEPCLHYSSLSEHLPSLLQSNNHRHSQSSRSSVSNPSQEPKLETLSLLPARLSCPQSRLPQSLSPRYVPNPQHHVVLAEMTTWFILNYQCVFDTRSEIPIDIGVWGKFRADGRLVVVAPSFRLDIGDGLDPHGTSSAIGMLQYPSINITSQRAMLFTRGLLMRMRLALSLFQLSGVN